MAVEMAGPWGEWKTKSRFPTLPTGPWKSRQHREISDRKSTRLNSSHRCISYAVFCLKNNEAQGSQRGLDYDTTSWLYAAFGEKEVLPLVENQYIFFKDTAPQGLSTLAVSSAVPC